MTTEAWGHVALACYVVFKGVDGVLRRIHSE
jgi:hypothetical protein